MVTIKCAICEKEITEIEDMYYTAISHRVVCKECNKHYIEVMDMDFDTAIINLKKIGQSKTVDG